MIYRFPALTEDDRRVLSLIQDQREQFRHRVNQNPYRWTGFLRRNTFARNIRGSNSIEGYDASVDEAAAIIDDDRPETVAEETYRALSGYRNAMTYILQVHDDPQFDLNAQFIKSLHFMMLSYDLTKLPGQWRPGSVVVVHQPTGQTVYEGPDATRVPALIDEMIEQIDDADGAPPIIRGALAHLNLAMIHPFKDCNGRMARALQTLVLAKEGIVGPVFSSIEEWLGRNTEEYYRTLAGVGQGSWHPRNDAAPWVRFCLRAHYQQAATLMRRNLEIGRVWDEVEKTIEFHSLHKRSEIALVDAAFDYRVNNGRYRSENEISAVVASRDLKKLCDVGLLRAVGEKRGRYYVASDSLKEMREKTREPRRLDDPYEVQSATAEPKLPGID